MYISNSHPLELVCWVRCRLVVGSNVYKGVPTLMQKMVCLLFSAADLYLFFVHQLFRVCLCVCSVFVGCVFVHMLRRLRT